MPKLLDHREPLPVGRHVVLAAEVSARVGELALLDELRRDPPLRAQRGWTPPAFDTLAIAPSETSVVG
jgi:hypothetical protein